jgi:hypothetical protein
LSALFSPTLAAGCTNSNSIIARYNKKEKCFEFYLYQQLFSFREIKIFAQRKIRKTFEKNTFENRLISQSAIELLLIAL